MCWRTIRRASAVPATLSTCSARRSRSRTFADRAGVMTITLARASTASRRCARCPHRPGRSRSCSRVPRVLAGWRARTIGHVLAARRRHRRAARHRHCLCHAGEPRPRRRRGLREGPRPDRFGAQPRPLRTVGLGHRARPHLLVGFRCTSCSATSARTSSCRSARSTRMVHPEDQDLYALAEQLAVRQDLARRSRIPHPQRRRRMGLAARPRRADERSGRRREPHLVGIAVDVTEQRGLEERTATRRRAPARRHRGDLGGLRALGCRQPTRALQFEVPASCTTCRRSRVARQELCGSDGAADARRKCSTSSCATTGRMSARAATRRGLTTAAGCRSTSAAPRTAATSRSAPTSPR